MGGDYDAAGGGLAYGSLTQPVDLGSGGILGGAACTFPVVAQST